MKYKIVYEYNSTRVSIVEANSKEEAITNFEKGKVSKDFEEDSEGSTIEDIEDVYEIKE